MPADTTVKTLHSLMPGASQINKTSPGSVQTILRDCLVNGWGLNTVDSLIVLNGTATVTRNAGHPFEENSVALIGGSSVAGINGEHRVLWYNSKSYTFDATGVADQTVTGTITHKVAPLGWSEIFSFSNVSVFQSSLIDSTRACIRVDDSSATTTRVSGYGKMTGVSSGTMQFPRDLQVSGGYYWDKNNPAPWCIWGDGKTFYYYVLLYISGSFPIFATGITYGFGDYISNKKPDGFNAFISGETSTGLGAGQRNSDMAYMDASTSNVYILNGATPAQNFSTRVQRNTENISLSQSFVSGSGSLLFPNYPDNRIYYGNVTLLEPGAHRGIFPGIYSIANNIPNSLVFHRDRLPDHPSLPGRIIKAIRTYGTLAIDETGPW